MWRDIGRLVSGIAIVAGISAALYVVLIDPATGEPAPIGYLLLMALGN